MALSWVSWLVGPQAPPAAPSWRYRPRLEGLEDRTVPVLAVTTLGGALNPTTLVNSLLGAGVTASNITYQGTQTSAGTFTGGTGIIGFESGIILSSGDATGVVGPNTSSGNTTGAGGGAGDADLDVIVTPNPTNDATVLEFDFVPQGAVLKFKYVFGSEEYNEFVGSSFNDVFAFFLNGTNVALIPGTSTAVSINNVNNGSNAQFYVDNESGALNTEMDGLTTVLTVTANVNAGVSNHIKLAVADAGDDILDSNVFIEAGSFGAPQAPVLAGYRPLRYAFRFLEQNQGTSGPPPIGGTAATPTIDGLLTLVNIGAVPATGTFNIVFRDLPKGVEIVNADGFTPVTNRPFITVTFVDLIPNGAPFRLPIKIKAPPETSPGTIFTGPFFIDVTLT